MEEWLNFIRLPSEGLKTKKFKVFSNHSGDFLGIIHWRNGWRCYVMSYKNDIDMTVECHEEVNKLIRQLESERKNGL